MKTPKFQQFSLYEIEFLDHTTGDKGIFSCRVVGYFIEESSKHIAISSWIVDTDDMEEKMSSSNLEKTNILKSSVTKVIKIE